MTKPLPTPSYNALQERIASYPKVERANPHAKAWEWNRRTGWTQVGGRHA